MKIDVKKIARLSNLNLTKSEEEEFDGQLNDILSYIEKLNSINTSNINPTAQVTGLTNVLKDDEEVNSSLSQEEALSGTDKKHNGLFVVDKLVDTNE